jgi:Mg2+/Co2+ transporter CorB
MTETVMNNVLASLAMMWKGMLGLFIVCGGVAVIMMIVTKLTKKSNGAER